MKETIFNAVTPSFVANKIHLIEIEVVGVTSTGNQVSANEALISTDDGEEKDELERKVFDPERFSSSFGVAGFQCCWDDRNKHGQSIHHSKA